MERIVGQAEVALAERINTLANAQGAAAEGLRQEIANGKKGDLAEGIAGLERRLKEDQRSALETLSKGLKQEFEALKASLDTREDGIFAGIDGVAENVKPAADVLKGLHHAVAGTAAAARDVAAIREAVVDRRSAVDEVVTIKETVTRSEKAIADVVAMQPALYRIAMGLETWGANTRRLSRFGWVILILLALLFGTAGVWLQRETGIWPTAAEIGNRVRDEFWERHSPQIMHCIDVARAYQRGMSCTIVDPDP